MSTLCQDSALLGAGMCLWSTHFFPEAVYVLPYRGYRIKSVSLLSYPVQLRSIPVKGAEDDELEEEADWIYRNAFATPTISLQVPKKRSLCLT